MHVAPWSPLILATVLAAGGCGARPAGTSYTPPPELLVSGTVVIADGVATLEFPREYRKRNHYTNCFDRYGLGRRPFSSRQEFCVSIVRGDSAAGRLFQTDSAAISPWCADCPFNEQVRTDTITLGAHTAVRQRALLLSGTIAHYHRHSVWQLLIPLSPALTAVFDVENDDRGAAETELLTIAGSLRLHGEQH
jgi:hypothetical protein